MSATDAARNFSDLLNKVARGEEIEVVRNGAEVALISPPQTWLLPGPRFRELISNAPRPDDDFAAELRAARASVGPPVEVWPS